jgi:hypothetical protein
MQASDLHVDPLSTAWGGHPRAGAGHRTRSRETSVPGGVTVPGDDTGPCPEEDRGLDGGNGAVGQRQRIDMIRPATMPPKPMAKFQAPIDTMKPILSPAT